MNIPFPPKQAVAAGPARGPLAEPSFADAISAIVAEADLSLEKKRHWPTSLRQMAGYLDKPLELIPARVAAIRPAVAALHPERLNVHAKTFANHRANVKAALLWFNRVTHGDGRRALMSDAYRAMLEPVAIRHVRDTLSPFFRFLTAWAIDPSGVTDAAVESFVQSTGETRFKPYTVGDIRRLVRSWNAHAGSAPGWPVTQLTEPPRSPTTTGVGWEDLPESFRNEVDGYFESLTRKRRSHKGRRLPGCKSSTIAMRRRELQAAVRTGVAAGIMVEDLQHLEDLLAPARVEIILDAYWRRSGERPSAHTIELSWRFLTMARERQLPAEDLERLEEMALSLSDHRRMGLTDKNREVVRQVIYGDPWSKVVHLPARMMAEARSSRANQPVKAAVLAQLAVAIRVLTFAPVRMGNLGAIRIDENLSRPGGPGATLLLSFPDYDVKNGVPLEFPLKKNEPFGDDRVMTDAKLRGDGTGPPSASH